MKLIKRALKWYFSNAFKSPFATPSCMIPFNA